RRALDTIGLPERPGEKPSWDHFVSWLGGPEAFRYEILKRVPSRFASRVMVMQADAASERRRGTGYAAASIRVSAAYSSKGLTPTDVRLGSGVPEMTTAGSLTPSVVHITASIAESITPREVFLVSGHGEPVRAESLAGMFSTWPEDQL